MSVYGFRFVTALLLSGLLVGSSGIQASAATTPPWVPTERTIISAPDNTDGYGSSGFVDEVCKEVKAAPAGATIRASTYWSSDADAIGCFIAARKNGANVRYTTWDDDYKDKQNKVILDKLKKELNDPTGKSYFKVCNGSCYKNKDSGTQHMKAVTISEVKGQDKKSYKYISLISSGNFSKKSSSTTWNYSTVFVNRQKTHDGLAKFMDGMKADKAVKKDFKAVVDGDLTLRFYPGGSDSLYNTLKQIKTAKVAKGYGKNGDGKRAMIRVVMYYWTSNHARIARELVRIKKLGADVEVAIKEDSTNDKIVSLLKKNNIPLYDTATKGRYAHGKVTVISAKVGKSNRNLTFSGSVNLTAAAFNSNTEVLVEQRGAKYRDDGVAFFNHVVKYSKKLK